MLHTTEETQHLQHLGWFTGGCHPTTDGLDSLHRVTGPRSFCAGRHSLCVAVSTLQRSQLETERGLFESWLPHDVCAQPWAVQKNFVEILPLLDPHLCPRPGSQCHHVVVLSGLTASEWMAWLLSLAILSRLGLQVGTKTFPLHLVSLTSPLRAHSH